MSESIVHLEPGGSVDPSRWLVGAWRSIGVVGLEAGDTHTLDGSELEVAAYVIRGKGIAVAGDERFAAEAGTAVTIPKGDRVEIEAGDGGMELFVTTLFVS